MSNPPRRDELHPHWQAVLDDLEDRLDVSLHRRVSLARRSRRYREELTLERLRVAALTAELATLRAQSPPH